MSIISLIGHLSFIAIAASFLIRDILWLRAVSILASTLAIIFNYFVTGGPIWIVIGWSFVFIAINAYNIILLKRERRGVVFTSEEQEMYETVFQDFSPVEFMKLLRIGQWKEIDADTTLIVEGQNVDEILFIYNGRAEVFSNGLKVSYLNDGAFVGEMEWVKSEPAVASVITTTATRYMSWTTANIKQLLIRNPSMKTTIHSIFNVDLMDKLRRQANVYALD